MNGKPSCNVIRNAALISVLILLVAGARADPVEGSTNSISLDEETKRLVVMIEAQLVGAPSQGAGIIVGANKDDLFIVTANHVVRRGGQNADPIVVRLRWQPEDPVQATLLSHEENSMDLAIIKVSRAKLRVGEPLSLPFHRSSDPQVLKPGAGIYLLGHPRGQPWRSHTSPEKFARVDGSRLEFESNLLAPGHSGGALLNAAGDIIGMLVSDEPPYGNAISIREITKITTALGYSTQLALSQASVSAGSDNMVCYVGHEGAARCWGGVGALGVTNIPGVRMKSLSAGGSFACGIDFAGKAYCIGNNRYGQLGNGTKSGDKDYMRDYETAWAVEGGHSFVAISVGAGHACGIATGGKAYCWGFGENGQLGDGLSQDSAVPVPVAGELRFASISAGWLYTCGVTDDGAIYCWGDGGNLRFGKGVPVRDSPNGIAFKFVDAAHAHACAIAIDGGVYCVGSNSDGQLGFGVKGEGSDAWQKVPLTESFSLVRTGASFTCGLTITGTAYCWGHNHFGQLGAGLAKKRSLSPLVVAGDLKFRSLDLGNVLACGITEDEALYCWGLNVMGTRGPLKHSESATPVRIPLDAVLPVSD